MNTCKKIIKRFQVAKSWAICALYYNKRPKKNILSCCGMVPINVLWFRADDRLSMLR